MKNLILLAIFLLLSIEVGQTQELDQLNRFANSLPVFISMAKVEAKDGVLTVGVFSDKMDNVNEEILEIFRTLRPWSSKEVVEVTGYETLEIVSLNSKNLSNFKGEVIWVLDLSSSKNKIKSLTQKGIFTIGAQDENFKNYVFTALIYEDKSSNPQIERWRLTELYANCSISPLRYNKKLMGKDYFSGKGCE